MKIYTKTGDQGETGLYRGPRVRKDSARIEAYGTVDELNAMVGLARAAGSPPAIDAVLERIQHELFCLGAQLATPGPRPEADPHVGPDQIGALEADIDRFEAQLPALTQFVLPAGSPAAAHLHVARTLCRRAERRTVTLAAEASAGLSEHLVVYLNRLSDLLFVLARAASAEDGHPDVPWAHG